MPLFPKNDEFKAFCVTNGYPPGYNDCMAAYLREVLGKTNGSINDLFAQWDGVLTSLTPTKEFLFTDGTMPTDITFTRSTVGTYCNSSGVLTSAAINTPRFDYDPVTLAIRGLLLEEGRTNACLYSEDLANAAWVKTRTSVTSNSIAAPDGATTADTLLETATAGTHQLVQAAVLPSLASGSSISLTCYAKQASGTRFLQFIAGGPAFATNAFAVFDLQTGVAKHDGGANSISVSIEEINGGWYRCIFNCVSDTLGNFNLIYRLVDSYTTSFNSYTGDGTSGIYIWGNQVENATNPTSYIVTTAAAVARGADVASITGTNFSDWYNATEGTFVVEVRHGRDPTGTYISVNDTTANEAILLHRTGDTQSTTSITDGGVVQYTENLTASISLARNVSAIAYKLNDVVGAVNGVAGTTDTSATIPTVTQLQFATTIPNNYHVRYLNYFDTRLSNAILAVQSQK